jgi:hypothetical protein
MEHSTVRKLIGAATLSLLALTGVAGLDVMAAGSAMAQPVGSGGGSIQGLGSDQPDPPSTPIPTPTPTPVPPVLVP